MLTVPCRLPDAVPAGPVLYKRILCPVDFSESSLRALDYATSLAREADAQLTVLHVISHEFENVMADVVALQNSDGQMRCRGHDLSFPGDDRRPMGLRNRLASDLAVANWGSGLKVLLS